MGTENKASPNLNNAIDSAMKADIVEPINSLPSFYSERYNYFIDNFIKYDAPVPLEQKKIIKL